MTTEQMTIHQALSELKTIDHRITKLIAAFTPCAANRHCNTKIDGMSIADFETDIQSQYDKINSLIKRRNAIKRAVTLSNAETTLTIPQLSITYTVAEAIEMKKNGILSYQSLLEKMTAEHEMCTDTITEMNGEDNLLLKADHYITELFGGGSSKDVTKLNADIIKKAKEDYIASNTYDLIDPLKIKGKIEKLSDWIDTFLAQVDTALSVSNATTIITVEY